MQKTKNYFPCGEFDGLVYLAFKIFFKLSANSVFGLLIVSTGYAKDIEVVAIPRKSLIFNEEKVGIFVKITNETLDKEFLLMGGLKDKNGIIYPRDVEYDLTLYEMKNDSIIKKSTTTGFLSQEFPIEESNYGSTSTSVKLGGQQKAYYYFEIIPFPKGQKSNYCVFKFRLPINNKMKEMVVNLERKAD